MPETTSDKTIYPFSYQQYITEQISYRWTRLNDITLLNIKETSLMALKAIFSLFLCIFLEIFFYADWLHRTPVPLHRDSEKPRNGSKVLTNIFNFMGSIFLVLFFAWLFKGFGKAITHTDKRKPRTNWDRLSYEQKAWIHDHDNGR